MMQLTAVTCQGVRSTDEVSRGRVKPDRVAFRAILEAAGISEAEYAVLWQVRDTVVQPRDALCQWATENLPNCVRADITMDECLQATDSLIRRGLFIELTAAEIEVDLARWRTEPLPVSWGVDRDRRTGDVDFSDAGFRIVEEITRQEYPSLRRQPVGGYNDEAVAQIRVFGETPAECESTVKHVSARIEEAPWRWPRDSLQIGPMRDMGPWWYSRFERISTGFEIVIRRRDAHTGNADQG